MEARFFESTGDAYDGTQCEDIPTGTVLIIPSEKVVGLAYTWPVAVTKEHGALHHLEEGRCFFGHGRPGEREADLPFTFEQIDNAFRAAAALGYEVV